MAQCPSLLEKSKNFNSVEKLDQWLYVKTNLIQQNKRSWRSHHFNPKSINKGRVLFGDQTKIFRNLAYLQLFIVLLWRESSIMEELGSMFGGKNFLWWLSYLFNQWHWSQFVLFEIWFRQSHYLLIFYIQKHEKRYNVW